MKRLARMSLRPCALEAFQKGVVPPLEKLKPLGGGGGCCFGSEGLNKGAMIRGQEDGGDTILFVPKSVEAEE